MANQVTEPTSSTPPTPLRPTIKPTKMSNRENEITALSLPAPVRPNIKPTITNLGVLSKLPVELLRAVAIELDVATFMDFRLVSRFANEVVEGMLEFERVTTGARTALRQICQIQTSRNFTFGRLYKKICTAECERCGLYARLLHLITCKRICGGCHKKYLPPICRILIRKDLSEQIINALPSMTITPSDKTRRFAEKFGSSGKLTLYDPPAAWHAGVLDRSSAGRRVFHDGTHARLWSLVRHNAVLGRCAEAEYVLGDRLRTRPHPKPCPELSFVVPVPWFNLTSCE